MTQFAIEARNIVKTFRDGEVRALDGVSLNVPEGQVFGLLGPNGSGKTTMVRILSTILAPDSGEAVVAGHDVTSQADAVRRSIGLAGQYATVDENLTGFENLRMIGRLNHLTKTQASATAHELLERFGLTDAGQRPAKTYSGGMRRRLDLSASLVGRPSILFLDEPTAGIDPVARREIWDLLFRLAAEGTTLFVTTHYMDEAEQCERIALMRAGEIIALDSPSGLKKTAFPEPLYELLPKNPISASEIESLRQSELFSDIEPYGLKYHVSVANQDAFEAFSNDENGLFMIREIQPTLEDVFIRMVEGVNR